MKKTASVIALSALMNIAVYGQDIQKNIPESSDNIIELPKQNTDTPKVFQNPEAINSPESTQKLVQEESKDKPLIFLFTNAAIPNHTYFTRRFQEQFKEVFKNSAAHLYIVNDSQQVPALKTLNASRTMIFAKGQMIDPISQQQSTTHYRDLITDYLSRAKQKSDKIFSGEIKLSKSGEEFPTYKI